MSGEPSKLLKLLDQLLPFLAVCPEWLQIWIHTLILLNCLTAACVAIFYLASKESAVEQQSLSHFSVDRPTNNEAIPLLDVGTWMITGTFPKVADEAVIRTADFEVQVYKLPARQLIPQAGVQKRLSTVDGNWRFESAKFDGYGSYEIVATGSLGGKQVYRTVTVKCFDKATAYKLSIERELKFRDSSNVVELPVEAVSLSRLNQIKEQFLEIQDQFVASPYVSEKSPTGEDMQQALAIVNRGLDLTDSVLPLWPNDYELQNGRAFFLKNYAMVTRDLKRPNESKKALEEAKLMFEAIREQQPMDANSWNGLGSVFMVSGQPAKALWYIDRALEIDPTNQFAQSDRKNAQMMIEGQEAAARK